jgi:hypothetical protein
MPNVRQTIVPGISVGSIKNIPDKWSSAWFRSFVSQYLQHADTRNATAGTGISISGGLGQPATIASSSISGPPYSVFGNPTGSTADNAGIQATTSDTVLQFSGSTLAFGKIPFANAAGLSDFFTLAGITPGSVLQAGTDGAMAAFSSVIFPTAVAAGDVLVGAQTGVIGSLPIGAPGDLLTASASGPQWSTGLPWSQITGTPTSLSGYGLPNNVSSGWGAPTGGAVQNNFSGAGATLAQTSAAVAQLIANLITAGIIGT